MIDALLWAVHDALTTGELGYDKRHVQVQPDGRPLPWQGDIAVVIYEGNSRSENDNCLMEYFAFNLALTMKVDVAFDSIGNRKLALRVAKSTGFNRRAEALRAFLHMNWAVLQMANDNLIALSPPDVTAVYGFCEPARYRGMNTPELVGGDWLTGDESSKEVALTAELRFEDARRMQALETFS